MIEPIKHPLTGRFPDLARLTAAVQRGTREALLAHARAGRAVPVLREGAVVWLQPEEIFALYPDEPKHEPNSAPPPGG
jgi:hypothetical protein